MISQPSMFGLYCASCHGYLRIDFRCSTQCFIFFLTPPGGIPPPLRSDLGGGNFFSKTAKDLVVMSIFLAKHLVVIVVFRFFLPKTYLHAYHKIAEHLFCNMVEALHADLIHACMHIKCGSKLSMRGTKSAKGFTRSRI